MRAYAQVCKDESDGDRLLNPLSVHSRHVNSGPIRRRSFSAGGFRRTLLLLPLGSLALLCAGCGTAPNSAAIAKVTGDIAVEVSASSLNFGSVPVGTAAKQTLRLTSSGTAAVTIEGAAVSGSGFAVSGASLPATLAPGQSASITVTFDPASPGQATGQLTVNTNAPTSPQAAVTLAGAGQAAVAPAAPVASAVVLSWEEPTGAAAPILGYSVYRAAGAASQFQLLNPTLIGSLSYTDATVQTGTTYRYYVTSIDNSGLQSAPSNLITVAIP